MFSYLTNRLVSLYFNRVKTLFDIFESRGLPLLLCFPERVSFTASLLFVLWFSASVSLEAVEFEDMTVECV